MVLFIILGVIVLLAIGVLGFLFFMLTKEGQKKEEDKAAVPLTDLKQLKKEFSSPLPDIESSPKLHVDPEIVPVTLPNVSLPTQEVKTSIENDTLKKRTHELEEELKSIKQKAEEQADVARDMILTLNKENQSLKNQQADLDDAQAKLTGLQEEASHLKTENITLQTQLEVTNSKVRLLEEEKAALKIQMEEEIGKAVAKITELGREKEALAAATKPESDEALRQEMEALKSEQIQLKQKYDDLEKASQELKALNTQLTEKNDALQYELVKARAQTSGLERVSFNYKNQLEDFLKKTKAVQVDGEEISQVKSRLEGALEEVKSQNEELLKKDQLAQFELEKSRSRLLVLEHDYQELKERLQKDAPS